MAKGKLVSPHLAMWLPNILLGALGVAWLVARAYLPDRSFTFRHPAIALVLPESRRRAGTGGRAVAAQAAACGHPNPPHLAPPLQRADGYVVRLYLRIFVLASAGLLGIFYIATFIDLSDKLFKGQTTGWMLARILLVRDASIHLLRDSAGDAHLHAGRHRLAHEELRARRDEGLRDQPLQDWGSPSPVRGDLERVAVRAGGESSGACQPPGRRDAPCHPWRIAFDVRRAEPQVDRLAGRRHLPLSLLRSGPRRAERALDLPNRSESLAAREPELCDESGLSERLAGLRRLDPDVPRRRREHL